MLNVKLAQVHDMLVFRGYNAFMAPNKDALIVAPSENNCYALIKCMDNKYFSINLLRCTTGSILKTDVARYSHTVVSTVEKLLKYSELILECKKTPVSDDRHLYVSITGQGDEVILSLMKNSEDIGPYAIKVLPVTFTGTYEVGYCKTDYAEYNSAYELIREFVK